MNDIRKKIIWVLTAFFLWLLISIFWYVCGIRGFCQNNNIKVVEKKPVHFVEEDVIINKPVKLVGKVEKIVDLKAGPVEGEIQNSRTIHCYTYLNSYMSLGSKKNITSEVLKLEKFLNKFENKNLALNGVYEEADKAAIEEFQEKNNLEVDGAVGPETQKIINAIYCVKTENNN